MTGREARADSLITSVLSLCGRVQPADLSALDEAEREPALRAYFDAHHDAEALHFEGDTLVADTESTEVSEIDQLLGDYTGVEDVGSVSESATVVPENVPEKAEDSTLAESAALKPQTGAVQTSAASPADKDRSLRSYLWLMWWVPSVLVPMAGCLLAWFFLRHKHERAARAMLSVGLVAGMIGSLLFLRYAPQIAGLVLGTSRGEVIKLPAVQPDGTGSSGSSTVPGGTDTTSGRQ